MTRVKGGAARHRKHRKVLTQAKGFRGTRHHNFKRANEAVVKVGEYAFAGRRQRRRDMRRLWIVRLNAALLEHNITYSAFIKKLNDKKIDLNRKVLSQMAIDDKQAFDKIVTLATS